MRGRAGPCPVQVFKCLVASSTLFGPDKMCRPNICALARQGECNHAAVAHTIYAIMCTPADQHASLKVAHKTVACKIASINSRKFI